MSTRKSIVLLETVHGSHLYGLNHPESDLDTYRVVTNDPYGERLFRLKTKQKITGEDDSLDISVTDFLLKADEGVPQALEAMFSPYGKGLLVPYARAYRLNTPRFAVTYRRTILNFARLGVTEERAKELLAPVQTDEVSKKRVKESVRAQKPKRVERNGLMKYRRHAMRLLLNLEEGIERGRFSPSLNATEKATVFRVAELEDFQFALLIKSRVDFFKLPESPPEA